MEIKNQQQDAAAKKSGSLTGLKLKMVGESGKALDIIGRARATLRRNGMGDQVDALTKEATAGTYQDLIACMCRWFDVQ